LAGGERIYSRWGYRPFFEGGLLDVIQPDLGNCGGITEGKKICDMAHVYDVLVQCHVCGSPIAVAASLQLEAVIPNFIIHEHHTIYLKDYNRNFCKYDYQPVNGYYDVPDKPGIGQELTEETIDNAFKITVK
jgi:L-alanine-DL-glutamate epimerase-like enolase superfamily enzyme